MDYDGGFWAMSTKGEETLICGIEDRKLRTSLDLIRQAAESIWAPAAPRIIRDFTDHGIQHSERLADFAAKLLVSNDGRPLSEQESYLLLAGIYLHDIGMQCDVVNYPKIVKEAERLGAVFDVEFTAKMANDYTIDEQKAIRKNHQYLTAAWIRYSRKHLHETALGRATQTIPEDILEDLMDVCKYHSRLPISSCFLTFKFDPTQRKQLIAALLRFCDELDVDGRRVEIDVVRNFRLTPFNSIYWWLHNRTKIVIGDHNFILLQILLHPEDIKSYGDLIHNVFITEFQAKNQPLIYILRQNSIPITIDAFSDVVDDANADTLPDDILEELSLIGGRKESLNELAEEVCTWLRSIRYEVSEPQKVDNRTIDMEATIKQGTFQQRILVRCIEGNIRPTDIDALDRILDRKTPQGWLITEMKISSLIRAKAPEDDSVQVFSLSEFLLQKVWGPYIDIITSLVENENINNWYVDISCYEQQVYPQDQIMLFDSLDEYIDDWLIARGKMHISLLGDFGSGKTWFCRHYTYRQLQRYLKDPVNQRLPLLITLRDFTKAMTIEQLINDALLEQYKLSFVGSAYEIFQEMNRSGKLLLILDGFDEMARQVDYQMVVDNFWELAKLVHKNSKVILTSRSEYFRWAEESEKILGGEEYGRNTILLSPPKFQVLYLEQLNDDMIQKIISLRKGEKNGLKIAGSILNKPNLAEMARKPVLVELLLAALDEGSPDILEKPAQVYLYSTDQLLLRNIKTKRTFTSTTDKLYFLCELAWKMIQSNELSIHYKDITELVFDYFKDKIKGQSHLDHWDYDLRTQTFLHRNPKGYYSFAHKSLAEYFVAFKFAAELGCLAPGFSTTYCDEDGAPCRIPFEQKDIFGIGDTFGYRSLRRPDMKTIRELLPGMMSEDAPNRFWRVIDETSGIAPKDVGFCVTNAATLLQDMGLWRPPTYEDITDLLEGMQKQPEAVFPPRPATSTKMEDKFLEVDIDVRSVDDEYIENSSLKAGHKEAILAYKSAKIGNFGEASDYASLSLKKNPELKYLCLSIKAYLGLQSLYLNNFQEAERYFNDYLEIGGNPLWYHLKMGLVRLQQRRIEDARDEAVQVLDQAKTLDCKDKITLNLIGMSNRTLDECKREIAILEGRAKLLLGILDRVQTKYDDSIELYKEALSIFNKEDDIYHKGIVLANMGIAYRMMSEFELAVDTYSKSFEIFFGLDDIYRMACVQARRGTSNRMLKKFEDAIKDYKKSIQIFGDLGDDLRRGIVLRELGTTYLILGGWDEAIDNYNQALKIFLSPVISLNSEVTIRVGLTLYSLGLAYLMQGKWESAIKEFEKALEIFREYEDDYNISLTLSSIGSAYRMMDVPEGARKYLSEALDIVRKLEDLNKESLILVKLGGAHRQLHKHEKAIELYYEALKIVRELKKDRSDEDGFRKQLLSREGKILGEIGTVYRRLNKVEDAIPYYENALDIFKALRDPTKVSWILEELGQVYTMKGLFDKAIDEYDEALKALREGGGGLADESLVKLAQGYIMTTFRGEIQIHNAAPINDIERLGNLALQGKTLCNLGEAYRRRGQFDEALRCLIESFDIVDNINDRDQKGRTLCYLGITHSSLAYSNVFQPHEPVNPVVRLRHYGRATSYIKDSISIFKNIGDGFLQGWALENLGNVYLMQELWDDAIDIYEEATKLGYNSGLVHLSLAICYNNYYDSNIKYDHVCKVAHELINIPGMNDYDLARLEANCGDRNKAFKLLESALEGGETNVNLIKRDPHLRSISDDPRFEGLVNNYGGFTGFDMQPFM